MELRQLLTEHDAWLECDASSDVIRCRLSGHTMPPRADVVAQYLRGRQFAKLRARQTELDALKEYEPHIVPSAYVSNRLFCRITGRLVHMNEAAVIRHSEGKRFLTQLEFVRAGLGLKHEAAPGAVAERAPEAAPHAVSPDADAEPAMWMPAANQLASLGSEDGSEPVETSSRDGAEEVSSGDDQYDWGLEDAAAEAVEAAVVRQPGRRAAASTKSAVPEGAKRKPVRALNKTQQKHAKKG